MYEIGEYSWQRKRWSPQGEGGVLLIVRGTRRLLLVGATDSYFSTYRMKT